MLFVFFPPVNRFVIRKSIIIKLYISCILDVQDVKYSHSFSSLHTSVSCLNPGLSKIFSAFLKFIL